MVYTKLIQQRCQWVMGKNPDLLFLKLKKTILGGKKPFLGHTVSLKIWKNPEIREFPENCHLWFSAVRVNIWDAGQPSLKLRH